MSTASATETAWPRLPPDLVDEISAVNAIFGEGTLAPVTPVPTSSSSSSSPSPHPILLLLRPPSPHPLSLTPLLIRFPHAYPFCVSPPHVEGTHSVAASAAKGKGKGAVERARRVLGEIWREGEVCVFELLGRLEEEEEEEEQGEVESVEEEEEEAVEEEFVPHWTLGQPLTIKKSVFQARACSVASLTQVRLATQHLLATEKRVARATHNVRAWRVGASPPGEMLEGAGEEEDWDSDGETGAGARLLGLMRAMRVKGGVLLVVSRWYGGVKLGGERFRVFGAVAREVLVRGGWTGGLEGGDGDGHGDGDGRGWDDDGCGYDSDENKTENGGREGERAAAKAKEGAKAKAKGKAKPARVKG